MHPLEKVDYDLLRFWFDEAKYAPADPWSSDVHKELCKPHYDSDANPLPTLCVVAGGEQAGKSFMGGHHVYASHLWSKIVWIVGSRYEDCRKEFEYLTAAAISAGVMDVGNVSFPANQACKAVFNNGCRVRTLSSDDATSLQGESPDGILMVEAGRQSYQAFRTLWTRAHHSCGWFLVSGTFESTKGRWFPDLWKQCCGDNEYYGKSFSLPSYANPEKYPGGATNPKIAALKKTLSEEEFAERILGQPRPSLGVVFPEFRRTSHVKVSAEYDPIFPVRLWVDPGFHPSSYAVLFVQIINDQIRIFKELYLQGFVNEQVVGMVVNDNLFEKVERVVIDIAAEAHAGAQDPAIETWRRGLVGRNIPIMTNFVKVDDGIQRTHDKLRINPLVDQPYMILHPRCENTITEFEEGYRFSMRRDNTIQQSGVPIDANNHSAKAIAYGIVDAFGYGEGPRILNAKSTRKRMKFQNGRR